MNLKHRYNQAVYHIQKYGLKNAIKKLISKTISKITGSNRKNNLSEREKYQLWIKANEPNEEELEAQRNFKFDVNPKISLLVPMYNTPVDMFEELVDYIIGQTYSNWELCLADGSPNENEELKNIYKKDSRIKYVYLNGNKGIAGNTNEALKLATGDYIALLDHDDLIPLFCLYEIVKCINNNRNVEFIYTDEDKLDHVKEKRFDPHFKPDFAPDTLRANNYITHLAVFKKTLMDKLGGFNDEFDGAQDYDIIIRATENTKNIVHIPKVLYHWRVHPSSTAMIADAKPYAYEAGKRVLESHLKRTNMKGNVSFGGDIPGVYEVQYDVIGEPKVAILIPNKDAVKLLKNCINSILTKTTYKNYEIVVIENNSTKKATFDFYEKLKQNPKIKVIEYPEKVFNYSAIINYGVRNCGDCDYIMQLNNDTKLITPNWLEKFIGFAQRKEIGAVGARLYYPDKSIQHAGIALGIGGVVANLYTKIPYGLHAYYGRECLTADVSCVTGACLFARRAIYEEVGFMDETFKVAFNDADFCLKIRQNGYLIVYNPYIELIHYESKTRGLEDTIEKKERFDGECRKFKEVWKEALKKGDPYYNINFSRDTDKCNIRTDKVDYIE